MAMRHPGTGSRDAFDADGLPKLTGRISRLRKTKVVRPSKGQLNFDGRIEDATRTRRRRK